MLHFKNAQEREREREREGDLENFGTLTDSAATLYSKNNSLEQISLQINHFFFVQKNYEETTSKICQKMDEKQISNR